MECIERGESPIAGSERLNADERGGTVRPRAANPGGGAEIAPRAATADLEAAGLVVRSGNRVALTPTGRLLATEVTLRLLPRGAETRVGTRYDGLPVGAFEPGHLIQGT